MKIDGQVIFGGAVSPPVLLSIAAGTPNTVATDASTANNFLIPATLSFTLSNPTGCGIGDDMQILVWRITQDSSGSRVITLGSQFKLGADIASVTLSTAANAIDYLAARFRYVDGTSNDRFDVIAFVKGYS